MVPAIEIAGFLNHLFLRNKLMKQPHFLHAATNSQKLKVDWKFLVGHGQKWEWWIWSLDSKTDYLKNEQIEVTVRFFACWYKFMHIKVALKFLGWAWSKKGETNLVTRTLKLTVSQKWTDGVNWFFAHWKAKSWFNDFWVGVVKYDHGLLVCETLKFCILRFCILKFCIL